MQGKTFGSTGNNQQTLTGQYRQDGRVKFFDRETGIRTLPDLLGHSAWIGSLQYDTEKIVSCSGDLTLRVWNWKGECTKLINLGCWLKRLQVISRLNVKTLTYHR